MSDQPKPRVLIVEDESLVAMLVEDMLVELGCEIAAIAGRVEQGVQFANDLVIDFAVLDLNLSGENSFPVAAILKARGVPFVFATGYGAAGVPDEWKHTPVIQKPFHMDELETAIARARSP
jgi:CheY-like chemotaxis protein